MAATRLSFASTKSSTPALPAVTNPEACIILALRRIKRIEESAGGLHLSKICLKFSSPPCSLCPRFGFAPACASSASAAAPDPPGRAAAAGFACAGTPPPAPPFAAPAGPAPAPPGRAAASRPPLASGCSDGCSCRSRRHHPGQRLCHAGQRVDGHAALGVVRSIARERAPTTS